MGDKKVGYRFLWIIENYSYCWHKNGERLQSPFFSAEKLEGTSWWIAVYPRGSRDEDKGYVSLLIGRNPADDGPEEIDLNYELKVFDDSERPFRSEVDMDTFKKDHECGWPQFANITQILSDDLVVECSLWKGKVREETTIRARTRITVEKVSYLHVVENFSNFEPKQKNTVQIQSESKKGVFVSSSLNFNYDSCIEGEMIVEIKPSNSNHNLCIRRTSLLPKTGEIGPFGTLLIDEVVPKSTALSWMKVLHPRSTLKRSKYGTDEVDNRWYPDRDDIQKLPLFLTRQDILNKESEYLPDDKLSLLCECVFSTGLEFEIIEEIHQKIPERGVKRTSEGIPHLMEEIVESESSIIDCTLEFRIVDFSTATEKICKECEELPGPFIINILASVFPNAADTSDEGWLVVLPDVDICDQGAFLKASASLWTVSIVDIEDNYRFPRYFEFYSHNFRNAKYNRRGVKYLEKSFILDRADELISDGVLLLRCDVRLNLDVKKECVSACFTNHTLLIQFHNFYKSFPCSICPKSDVVVLDYTSRVLTLPQFHESRKRFGVYGFPAESSFTSKVIDADSLDDVWIFDTDDGRFLLSVSRSPGNLGSLLLDASVPLGLCIDAALKEQHEKRIDLSHVRTMTFNWVLYFLVNGELPTDDFFTLMEMYKFSQLYEMRKLQQKCAERMVVNCPKYRLLKELSIWADKFSDEYLLNLLEPRLLELGYLDGTRKKNRLNFNCYI